MLINRATIERKVVFIDLSVMRVFMPGILALVCDCGRYIILLSNSAVSLNFRRVKIQFWECALDGLEKIPGHANAIFNMLILPEIFNDSIPRFLI